MSNVVDLLTRRQTRGEPALHFRSATEALAYAARQVRDLERLTGTALVIAASDLELPLAQVAAILAECSRLHAHLPHEEGNG